MSVATLPGTEDHPQARMVLDHRARRTRPRTPTSSTAPPGTGKSTAARAFAAELLAEGSDDPGVGAPPRGERHAIPT